MKEEVFEISMISQFASISEKKNCKHNFIVSFISIFSFLSFHFYHLFYIFLWEHVSARI